MRPVSALLTLALLVVTVTIPLVSEVVSSGVGIDNPETTQLIAQALAVAERRREVVDDLLAGRRSLGEAAAQFRALADDAPYPLRDWMRRKFPRVASEEGRFHEHVVVFSTVRAQERGLNSGRPEALRRELDALYQAGAFADRP